MAEHLTVPASAAEPAEADGTGPESAAAEPAEADRTGPESAGAEPAEADRAGAESAGAGSLVGEELLVEEVSIDGMCGVY